MHRHPVILLVILAVLVLSLVALTVLHVAAFGYIPIAVLFGLAMWRFAAGF